MATATSTVVGTKRSAEEAELEIDINAPEPPSKKALRKAKKRKDSAGDNVAAPTSSHDVKPDPSATDGKDGNDGKRSEHGIWIGNLSFTVSKDDLLNFLTGVSGHAISRDQITRINLPMSTERKAQNKGFAYVDFISRESTTKALQLSEALVGGRRVLIKDARNFEGRPSATKGKQEGQGKAPSKRIFVGNLAFDITVEQLEEHFKLCGSIQHTHMATFEDTGKCKGYAWIEFEQLSSAEAAMRGWIEIRGHTTGKGNESNGGKQRIWLRKIDGRQLRMEFAEDKTTRYNKRYGKNATIGKAETTQNTSDGSGLHDGMVELPDAVPSKHGMKTRAKPRQGKSTFGDRATGTSKYSAETVQKLTGAIVEGQGKKVVFD